MQQEKVDAKIFPSMWRQNVSCANQKPCLIVNLSVSDAAFLIWRTPGCYLGGALRDQLNKGFERDQDTFCYFFKQVDPEYCQDNIKKVNMFKFLDVRNYPQVIFYHVFF